MRLIVEAKLIINSIVSWEGPGSLLVALVSVELSTNNNIVEFGCVKEKIRVRSGSLRQHIEAILDIVLDLQMDSSIGFKLSFKQVKIHSFEDWRSIGHFGGDKINWSKHQLVIIIINSTKRGFGALGCWGFGKRDGGREAAVGGWVDGLISTFNMIKLLLVSSL